MRLAPGIAAFLLGAAGCRGEPGRAPGVPEGEAARPDFLIIDIDSLRADRWLAEYDGEPVAPNLRALAARGVVFDQAFAQSSWTLPGLASVLSGHWPVVAAESGHGFWWLSEGARTLPEILGYYGYHTVFWGGAPLAADQGLRYGFAEQLPRPTGGYHAPGDALAAWLREEAEEPFFAFLHDADLHMPQTFTDVATGCRWAPYHGLCADGGPNSPSKAYSKACDRIGPRQAAAQVRAEYDGSITSYDAGIPALLAALDERGFSDHTVVVLVSNHGEDLGEHGAWDHGMHFDTVLHVPLFIVDPRPGMSHPRHVAEVVQAIDLAPTLLELAGVPADASVDGTSLVPLLSGRAWDGGERSVYSLSDRRTASVRTPTRKLIHATGDHRSGVPVDQAPLPGSGAAQDVVELYDLATDPGELHDLMGATDPPVGDLEDLLTAWVQQRVALGVAARPGGQGDDPALRDRLQQDGYWRHLERDRGAPEPRRRLGPHPPPDEGR